MAPLTQWTWVWPNSGDGIGQESWHAAVHGVTKNWTWLTEWTPTMQAEAREDETCLWPVPISEISYNLMRIWGERLVCFLGQVHHEWRFPPVELESVEVGTRYVSRCYRCFLFLQWLSRYLLESKFSHMLHTLRKISRDFKRVLSLLF